MLNVQHGLILIITITVWLLCPSSTYGRHLETKESEIQDDDDDDDDDSDVNLTLRFILGVGGAILLIGIVLGTCFACSKYGCLPNNGRWIMGQWGNTIENDDVTNLQESPSQNTDGSISANEIPSAPNLIQEQSTAMDDIPSFLEVTTGRDNSSPANEDAPPPSYYDATISSFRSSVNQPAFIS